MIAALFNAAAQQTDPLTVAWLATVAAVGVIAGGTLGWDAWARRRGR